MVPTSFAESNGVLDAPKGMEAECDPLSVAFAQMGSMPCVVSCWKLTTEELETINRTGRVWLLIAGQTMPPVVLQTEKPFKE